MPGAFAAGLTAGLTAVGAIAGFPATAGEAEAGADTGAAETDATAGFGGRAAAMAGTLLALTPGVILAVPDFGGAEGILTRVVSFFAAGAIKDCLPARGFGATPEVNPEGNEAPAGAGALPAGGGIGLVAAGAGFGGKGIRTVSFLAEGLGMPP